MKNPFSCFLIMMFSISNISSQFTWHHTDGPYGSWTSFIYTNDEYAFVLEDDFMFRTADGIQWEKIEHSGSYHLAIYGDTLVHAYPNSINQPVVLHFSTDNAETWMAKEVPAEITGAADIAVNHQGIFLVRQDHSYFALFRSVDFGETWDTIHTPIPLGSFDVEVFDDRLYLHTSRRLYRLGPAGENWEQIFLPNQNLPQQNLNDLIVTDSHIMFTTTDHLFHSHDNGASWAQLDFKVGNSFDQIVMTDDFIYADIYGMILRTADYGLHWDTIVLGDDHPSFVTLGGFKDIFLASTSDKGVYKWDESGGRMIESNKGLGKGAVYDLSSGGDFIWAACGNGIFRYDTDTKIWSDRMNLPDQSFGYQYVSCNDAGWVVAAGLFTDSFFISENFGESWRTIQTNKLIFDLQLIGEHIFLNDYGSGLYRSINQGEHFEPIQHNIFTNDFVSFKGNYYLPGSGNWLYGTEDGGLTWFGIYNTVDIGRLHAAGDHLFGLGRDTNSNLAIFISDDGIQWSAANDGLPPIDYFDVLDDYRKSFFFRDADYFYAFLGLDTAFFSPVDNIQWSPFEIEPYVSNFILYDHVLYRGDAGIYATEIENPFITAIKEYETNSTGIFSLSPNPAKELVEIRSEVNQLIQGKLSVYSSNGISVISFPFSNHEGAIEIQVDQLKPGIYFVKIDFEDRVEVLRFVKE